MTLVMRVLRIVFFRPVDAANDRDRRLAETGVRIDHAERMLGNATANLTKTSEQLRQAKENMVDQEMLDVVRRLSTTLDSR